MTAHFRRGACPSLFEPMPTGDGLLARLPPSARPLPPPLFAELCAAAQAHGNGIIEVTQRGSLQIRGLTPSSAVHLAETAARLGIERSESPAVITNPLSGLDRAEAMNLTAVVAELRAALNEASFANAISPKISIVIDGGGVLHLDGLPADIRLRAELTSAGALLYVAIGGDATTATPVGAVAPENAIGGVLGVLATIAQRGRAARARDILHAEGPGPFHVALEEWLVEGRCPACRPVAEPIGVHQLGDGRVAVGLGLAFGQTDAAVLSDLARTTEHLGATGLIPAERRSLIVTGLPSVDAPRLASVAEDLGFITKASDPRRHVIACAGAPACAAGVMPARGLGPAVAAAAAPLLDGSLQIHISGCAKGCANPGSAALTFVGADGRCGVLVGGSARTTIHAFLEPARLTLGLSHLAEAAKCVQRPGENAADVLARFGAQRIAALILAE